MRVGGAAAAAARRRCSSSRRTVTGRAVLARLFNRLVVALGTGGGIFVGAAAAVGSRAAAIGQVRSLTPILTIGFLQTIPPL